jgi:hypothetical protein
MLKFKSGKAAGARDISLFRNVYNGSGAGAHPASYKMGMGDLSKV